tara:strand:+ start:318 stop:503 length:186 start_codon:yes stop_codon:yes gene_type:complete
MKIVLVTLTITLSVMLAHQDNKVKELENQLNKIEVEYAKLDTAYRESEDMINQLLDDYEAW